MSKIAVLFSLATALLSAGCSPRVTIDNGLERVASFKLPDGYEYIDGSISATGDFASVSIRFQKTPSDR